MGWSGFKRLVVGVGHDPVVVAAVRSLAYILLPLLVDGAIYQLNHSVDPRILTIAPSASGLLRVLEGAVDRQLKPLQNSVDPSPVAGGGSVTLTEG